jgi:hypothetical protein
LSLVTVGSALPGGVRGRDAVPLADVLIAIRSGAISVSITLGVVARSHRTGGRCCLAVLHVARPRRRRTPALVLGAMAVTGVVYVGVGFPPVGLGPAIVAAVYMVAVDRPRSRSVSVG